MSLLLGVLRVESGALLDRACKESLAETGATICDPPARPLPLSVDKNRVEIARTNDMVLERLGELFATASRGLFGGTAIEGTAPEKAGNSFASSRKPVVDTLLALCMRLPQKSRLL